MYGEVPELDDIGQLPPGLMIYSKAEARLVNHGLQIVLIRHLHGIVCGIDPLDRQFQSLTAANGAHGRRRRINPLRLQRSRSKQGVFFDVFEEFKIGHNQPSSVDS